jgi:methyltransferase-like protein
MMPANSDHYIYHEHLEEQCEPLYFHEFVRRARNKGLAYLGETSLAEMATANLGPRANKALSSLARNTLEAEQYMDFLCNRMFRKTLLHRDGPTPRYDVPSRNLWTMYIASGLQPESPPVNFSPGASSTFVNRAGDSVCAELPLMKAALLELAEHWPAGISFERLLTIACERLSIGATELRCIVLSQAILSVMTQSGSIEVSVEPPRFTACPSEMPTASWLARHQAATGTQVTNCRHESVELSPIQQQVIQVLDGSHRVAELAPSASLSLDDTKDQISQLARLALIVD